MSRVIDVDGDGFMDLIVVNGENGVTSELDSYVYWGGPGGLTGERAYLPAAGAYDVVALDLTGNGLLDLILPSAWVDHHNPGRPRQVHVYEQVEPRRFEDCSDRYGLIGIGAASIACDDLNGDGYPDLDLDGFPELVCVSPEGLRIFHGGPNGPRADNYTILPGKGQRFHYVLVADFDRDGRLDLLAVGYTHDAKPETMAASSVLYFGSPARDERREAPDHQLGS